jgi:hypothetical protein
MENGRWRDLPLSDSQETLFLKKQTRKSEANNEVIPLTENIVEYR